MYKGQAASSPCTETITDLLYFVLTFYQSHTSNELQDLALITDMAIMDNFKDLYDNF
jgi:hypothetical protein